MRSGSAAISALETIAAVEGLRDYLDAVEERLDAVVAAHPGTVAAVGADALAAGGKRLRPTLTFLSSPVGAEPPVVQGAAVELVHMATLIHDDIVDGAHVRRGRAAAWTQHGSDAAKAAGDHLFAAAFAALASTGSHAQVGALADASLALARGEAMQRLQRHDPSTTVDAYLERCALKTGSLFAAACILGGGTGSSAGWSGSRSRSSTTCSTAPARPSRPGRSPAPTCATGRRRCRCSSPPREDEAVRAALAGGPLEGALVRVAATGALERSREVALDYAARARASLDGSARRRGARSARRRRRRAEPLMTTTPGGDR